MNKTHGLVSKMFEYNVWAFDLVWDCVEELTDEQFCQEIDYSRGSIRNQIVHDISTCERWLERIQSRPAPDYLENDAFPTKKITRERWDTFCGETRRLLGTLNQADLSRSFHWTLPHRNMEADSTVEEILLHLFNHATDHRAQILADLHYGFTARTVEQDLLFFFAEEQAEK
ncbi:MAG TPA: DinB family protein [Anaerolineales bacterium]|nr:DinB family protein [Anaerolineales bacterium]